MSEPDRIEIADAPADLDALIVSLHTQGAHRFDPVRWHYLEVLAARSAAHQGSVKRMLDAKLAQAIASFRERFDRAQSDAGAAVARSAQQYPHAAAELQRLYAAGDFKGLLRSATMLGTGDSHASLRALVQQLDHHAAKSPGVVADKNAGSPSELKTVRQFRKTWSKLSVDKQVAQALEQAPKNAGPINSHMLVLRSLELMRDISPDYLNRFMSYAETLLSLDQGEKEKPATPKKPQGSKATKK